MHRDQRSVRSGQPQQSLGTSSAMLLCCTAYEFGDPFLTPAPIWPGGSSHEDPTLHPTSSTSPRRRSLVTATIYPLHQQHTQHQQGKSIPGSRFSFGTPFPSATVRMTKQGVTIYRQSDRSFLVDIRWADVTELKRHTPADEPSMMEIALVFTRGIVVMDVASPHVAAGIWATLQHFHTLTDAVVVEELRRAAWGQALGGAAVSPSESDATGAQSPAYPQTEPEIVGRAKEILERYLGPHHNLMVTSPNRPPAQVSHAPMSAAGASQQRELLSPSDSPHMDSLFRHDDDHDHSVGNGLRTSAAAARRRSASQLSARARADELRREQDEQLQRIRKRESEMRSDIHHIASSSRATTPRSASTASTALGGHIGMGLRSDSPDVNTANERRRRAAAAGRSGTPSATPPLAAQSIPARRAGLPAPLQPNTRTSVSSLSAAVLERTSISQASYVEASQPNSRLDELEYQAMRSVQAARLQEREELTSDIANLMDSLEEAGRSSAAGASAQARRLTDVLAPRVDVPAPIERAAAHLPAAQALPTAPAYSTPVLPEQPRPLPAVVPAVTIPEVMVAPPAAAVVVAAPPTPAVAPPTAAPSNTRSPSAQWVAKRDPQGKEYYVNIVTKTSTWKIEETDLHASGDGPVPSRQQPAGSIHAPTPAVLPQQPAPGWRVLTSDKGVPYYYHAPTKTTTWKVQETYSILAAAGIEIEDARPPAKPTQPVASTVVEVPAATPAPQAAPLAAAAVADAATPSSSTESPQVTLATKPAALPVPTVPAVPTAAAASDHTTTKASIQTDEDIRRENEARKQQAVAKAEDDKQHLRFGKMSLAEALQREQDALNKAAAQKVTPPPPPALVAAVTPSPVPLVAESPSSPSAKDPAPAAAATTTYGEWRELQDKKTGRTYYRNTRTQEASWKVPEEVRLLKEGGRGASTASATSKSASVAAASPSQGRSANRTKDGWVEKFDEGSKRYFYVHSETKARTWKIQETAFAGDPPQ